MRRKILSFLLVFCMVLTLLPASALATEVDGEQGNEPAAVSETENTQTGDETSADPSQAGLENETEQETGIEPLTDGESQEGATTQGTDHKYKLTSTSGSGEPVKYYITMAKAIEAAQSNDTITLLADVEDGGIQTTSTGKTLTIDFDNHTYTSSGSNPAGSLQSQVCQVLKDNTITMKNGTLAAKSGQGNTLKTLIQNYGTLTLTNMTLDGTNLGTGSYSGVGFPNTATFTLNSYNGDVSLTSVTIKNSTSSQTAYSIGCGWWPGNNSKQWYPDGTTITVNSGCSFDNVLVYRDDKNQAAGSDGKASSIKVGNTTIKGEWTDDDCYTEYLHKDGGLVPVFTAGTTTLTSGDYILTQNVDLTKGINVTGKVTLDLNGKTIGVSSDSSVNIFKDKTGPFAMFNVKGTSGELTIKDSGTGGKITAKKDDSYVVDVLDSGKCTIEGGELTGNISVVQVNKGTLTVTGGTFKITQLSVGFNDYRFMLNCIDDNYKDGSAKIEVKGGTFYGFDPGSNLAEQNGPVSFLAEGFKSTETTTASGDTPAVWTVTAAQPETPLSLTIGNLETFPEESWWSGITKAKLVDGDLGFATEDQTVTVTGTLRYAEWEKFNSDTTEQAGHYLPLQIKLSDATRYSGQKVTIKGATEKVLNFSSDGSFELAMFLDKLDGKNGTTEGQFTITLGEGENAKVYTVDCTGLTLLPKAAAGTTVGTTKDNDVEAKPESDNSGTSVVIPADVDGLDEMTVKVTNVSDKTGLVPNDVNLAEGVADAIKGNGSKVVEVTVTKKNTSGGEDEQFTSSNPLQGKKITITIGGLTPNTTYYLFCITESSVTYCGNTFVTKASMEFTTTHLCKWAAVKENDDLKAANLVESDDGVKLNNGEAKTLTLTEASGKNGYSISLSGVSNAKYVVVQVKAKNSAVYAIGWYELKTSENTLYVGKGNGESVEVWLLSAEPTFTESGNFNNDQSNIVAYGKSN